MSDDNPSDMEGDESSGTVNLDVKPISPSFAKDVLISELGSSNSLSRIEVNEYVLALERDNPTKEPTSSKLLNGVWELLVSGFGTPGLVAYQALKLIPDKFIQLQDVTVTISSVAPRVTTTTHIKGGPFEVDISVNTDLEAVSGARLKESYVSGKISSLEIPLSAVNKLTRELIVTYLDEDLLIARDCFGSPEILRRKAGNLPKSGSYDVPTPDSPVASSDETPGATA